MRILRFFFVLSLLSSQYLLAQDQWNPAALMELTSVGHAAVSPDGSQVIYHKTLPVMAEGRSCYQTQLFKGSVNGDTSTRQFTYGEHSCFAPQWSPDGQWIAFLSKRNGSTAIRLIRSDGGESFPLTNIRSDIAGFRWSPDSKQIAFVAATELTAPEQERKDQGNDAFVFGQQYRSDQLWLVNVAETTQTARQLTNGRFHVRTRLDFSTTDEEFDWAPDGKSIVFSYSQNASIDSQWMDSHLAVVNLADGVVTPLPKQSVHDSMPRYSPDGHWIAFMKGEEQSNYLVNRRICLYSITDESVREMPVTPNEGPFLVGRSLVGWTKDGRHVLFMEPQRLRNQLMALPLDGREPIVVDQVGDREIDDVILSPSREYIGFVGESLNEAPELYVVRLSPGHNPSQVTAHNAHLAERPLPKTERIAWRAADGQEIEALLTYPLGYQEGTQVPLVLMIHGGPMGAYHERFVGRPYPYPLMSFAEAGFAVLRANPRGSAGYGKAFREANIGDWGGADFEDLMLGVDTLVSSGVADPEKLGVCGWSYGGYMTAWTISQTDRFKAASMGAGLSDLTSMAGTSDLEHFIGFYLGGELTEKEQLYRERSPLSHVSKVSTPCLIQHPAEDHRVPVGQSMEFYQALRKQGKPVSLVIYPRVGHHLAEPRLMLDAMERNLAWFKEHLG